MSEIVNQAPAGPTDRSTPLLPANTTRFIVSDLW